MNIETKLREGSQAIKQATRQAEFTSVSPTQRRGLNGPVLAWATGLAVVVMLAIPALLAGVGGQPAAGGDVGAAPTSPVEAALVFPHLGLDVADTTLVDAYEIVDDITGDRIGTHQVYHMALTGDPDGWKGREFLLRIQELGTEFHEFDYYTPLADSTESITVDGRDVTVYLVPDEAIREGTYDQAILQWTEGPGYEVILVPWGLGTDEALRLMDGLKALGETEWEKLSGLESEQRTLTTLIESGSITDGS